MFTELQKFIRKKLAWIYDNHVAKYDDDVLQDDIYKEFCEQFTGKDLILALVEDVRFVKLFDDWLKTLTWQDIMLQEEEKPPFDYKSYFNLVTRINRADMYERYKKGDKKVPVDISNLCYVYDTGIGDMKTRLEFAFPVLFGKEKPAD